jgi:hypothetical protein
MNLVLPPQHDPPTHKHFLHSLIIKNVREYSPVTHILAPFSLAPTSFNTTLTFIALHLKPYGFFLFLLKDYKPNQDLELLFNYFKVAF